VYKKFKIKKTLSKNPWNVNIRKEQQKKIIQNKRRITT
jgi:hypothetical protein